MTIGVVDGSSRVASPLPDAMLSGKLPLPSSSRGLGTTYETYYAQY